MSERVKRTCAICGKVFDLGWNGVCPDEINMCDACAGIEREPESIGILRQAFWILVGLLLLALAFYAGVTL